MRQTEMVAVMAWLTHIYNQEITDALSDTWYELLGHLSREEFARAIKEYVLDPESKFFPKPGQIMGIARPKVQPEEESSLVVDLIFSAVQSYGADPIGEARAKKKIGEIGWQWVQIQGGWAKAIQSCPDNDSIPIWRAQTRKSIMGLMAARGKDMRVVPEIASEAQLKQLGVEMKKLN